MARRKKREQTTREKINELARMFYRMQGCVVLEGYRFDVAHHPAEQGCWTMAVVAYEFFTSNEADEMMAEEEDDE